MSAESHTHGVGAAGHAQAAHEHPHPQARQYLVIAAILTVITILEVAIFYIEPIKASLIFAPLLLALSALKFALVAMFYMHLKFDGRLLSTLFVGPLLIAAGTIVALLFLFDHFVLG
ncbi:MAG: cytochrome C oxidase subunit IV family protein [Gemmatimonadota bacterium]